MTIIIATKINNNALHLHGDSIETSEIAKSPGIYIPAGITSHNEKIKAVIINEEKYAVFKEKVCKIGRLSNKLACSITGYSELAYAILQIVYTKIADINSPDQLASALNSAKISLEPTTKYSNQSCCLLLIALFDKLYCFKATFKVSSEGVISLNLNKEACTDVDSFMEVQGSGRNLMDQPPSLASQFINSDKETEEISTELLAQYYSSYIRLKTNNIANGIGGAILGLKLTNNDVHYMKDTIFLYANKNNILEVAVKIIHRNGLFIVTDFIGRTIVGLWTLEAELERRKEEIKSNEEVSALITEASTFQAPLVLIITQTQNTHPEVGIVNNTNLPAIVQNQGGIPALPAGAQLNIISEDKTYSFTVRS